MKATRIPGLFFWSAFQNDRGIDFNGFLWRRSTGPAVLIDPMPLDAEQEARVAEEPVGHVIVTNADHWRASSECAKRFGARIVAPACDRDRLTDAPADTVWFGAGAERGDTLPDGTLPDGLADDIEVRWIRGGKTPAEAVLYLRPVRAIVFGDAVRSHESGALRLLPAPKVTDHAQLVRDVQALANLNFDAILLGDGDPILVGAKGAFLAFARGGCEPAPFVHVQP